MTLNFEQGVCLAAAIAANEYSQECAISILKQCGVDRKLAIKNKVEKFDMDILKKAFDCIEADKKKRGKRA